MHKIELTYFNYIAVNVGAGMSDAILKCTLTPGSDTPGSRLIFHFDYLYEVDYPRDPDIADPAALLNRSLYTPVPFTNIDGPPDERGVPISGPFYKNTADAPGVDINLSYITKIADGSGVYWVRIKTNDFKQSIRRLGSEQMQYTEPGSLIDHSNPRRRVGWPDLLLRAYILQDGVKIHTQHFVRSVLP